MPLASNYKASSQSESRQRCRAIGGNGSVVSAGVGCARGSGPLRPGEVETSQVGGRVVGRLQNGRRVGGRGSPDGLSKYGRQLRPSLPLGGLIGRSRSQR